MSTNYFFSPLDIGQALRYSWGMKHITAATEAGMKGIDGKFVQVPCTICGAYGHGSGKRCPRRKRAPKILVVKGPEMSVCCEAYTSVDEFGVVYCKACYEAV